MNLTELKERIDRTLAINGGRAADADVVVLVHRPGSIGPAPCVDVEFAGMGIDWDAGKFQLTCDAPVTSLTKEQVEELWSLASKGVTWGSYQEWNAMKDRLLAALERAAAAESKLATLGYATNPDGTWRFA